MARALVYYGPSPTGCDAGWLAGPNKPVPWTLGCCHVVLARHTAVLPRYSNAAYGRVCGKRTQLARLEYCEGPPVQAASQSAHRWLAPGFSNASTPAALRCSKRARLRIQSRPLLLILPRLPLPSRRRQTTAMIAPTERSLGRRCDGMKSTTRCVAPGSSVCRPLTKLHSYLV